MKKRGYLAVGAPVLPQPGQAAPNSRADGELIVAARNSSSALIGYYTSRAKANRLYSAVAGAARQAGGHSQEHNAEIIVWPRNVSSELRRVIDACL